MSLKPPKKSDLGKSWMKNRRDKARMIQPEYHLIAWHLLRKCESDKKVQHGIPQSMQMQGSFWSSAIRVMLWLSR